MDKILLEALRKLLALNAEVLPDSMTPEQFGKFVDDQAGKLFIKPEDVKNLQKVISQKDLEIKKLSDQITQKNSTQGDDKISALQEQINTLTKAIETSNTEKKIEKLKERYPDISPRLLINLTDEEIEKVAQEQREIAKKHYKGADIFSQTRYSSLEDFDKELETIKSNKDLTALDKAAQILALNRAKNNFQPV